MSERFLKFKRRRQAIRVIKSLMIGASAGLLLGGLGLLLPKLAVLNIEPIIALFIGLGAFLVTGAAFFLCSGMSDKKFAKDLDTKFGLQARVQTMVAYKDEESDILTLQREDTDKALSDIPLRSYKFKKLWVYITALVLTAAILATGIVVEDRRNVTPPEQIVPFELSEVQRTRLNELIKTVEKSEMEEQFRTPLANELRTLLQKLEAAETEPQMQIALAESMAIITEITYDSSTATEMLNALWDTKDVNFRHLAKVLDTSSKNTPDWGEFAEKMNDYIIILTGEGGTSESTSGAERIRWALDSMNRKLDVALKSSDLPEDDSMYVAVNNLFNRPLVGFSAMINQLDDMSDEDAKALLENGINIMSEDTFAAIKQNKINASTGEDVMTRLAALFPVPLPEFERPEFVKTGEPADPESGDVGSNDDDDKTGPGGVGKGESFGSDDEVLNPQTGKLEAYGNLIHTYNAIMFERLQGDYYTEEQKEAITKYFELLYGGLEEDE